MKGIIPSEHVSELPATKHMKEMFPVGKTVKARVLFVDAEKKLIFCTCKRSLLREDCVALTSYKEAKKGACGACV